MATIKEIKTFLKESGLKEADIDKMWAEAIPGNTLLQNLDRQGIGWRKLTINLIKQIPDEKENQIKRAEKIRQEENRKQIAKENEQKEKDKKEQLWNNDYYVLNRLLSKDLTSHELCNIVGEETICEVIKTIEGGHGRWQQEMETIVQIADRYFSINWSHGLTEYQEDIFTYQPVEVVSKQRQIIEVYWEKV